MDQTLKSLMASEEEVLGQGTGETRSFLSVPLRLSDPLDVLSPFHRSYEMTLSPLLLPSPSCAALGLVLVLGLRQMGLDALRGWGWRRTGQPLVWLLLGSTHTSPWLPASQGHSLFHRVS